MVVGLTDPSHLLSLSPFLLSSDLSKQHDGLNDEAFLSSAMSVTLHTTIGDIKIEIFCKSVPKTAEVSHPPSQPLRPST